MFCFKCGKQLPNNALFCNYCGAKIPQKAIKTSAVVQNEALENKNSVASNETAEKKQAEQAQNMYNTVSAATPHTVQQPYSVLVERKGQKKSMVLPIVIGASALAIVAAIIVLIVFVANIGENNNDNATNSFSTSEVTTTAPPEEETIITTDNSEDTEESENRIELIDDVPAANGHYTTKDLGGYMGRTGDEITNEFGSIMAWQTSLNVTYEYDNITFWIVDDYGVTEIQANADIIEFKGETLDKTYDELISLLGTPLYDYVRYDGGQIIGSINYLMNENLYVTIGGFDSVSGKASSVDVTIYIDELPFELDYLKEIIGSRIDFENIFGYPTYARFDSGTYSMIYSYKNFFTIYVSDDDQSLSSLETSADYVTIDGETLDKSLSEIREQLGAPNDEWNDSDKYCMHYIVDEKIDLFIWAENEDGNAQSIFVSPYQANIDAEFSTRDGYNSTLTLDAYGGFVLSVNVMVDFKDFSGSYYKTKDGYRFEVVVGREGLQEFEMKWIGDVLMYYGNDIGATWGGRTIYYPVRTIDEIKYNGDSVVNALGTKELGVSETILYGEFNPADLSVDDQKLNVAVDELAGIFGALHGGGYDDYSDAYQKVCWLKSESTYKTFEVRFYYLDYDDKVIRIEIKEFVVW